MTHMRCFDRMLSARDMAENDRLAKASFNARSKEGQPENDGSEWSHYDAWTAAELKAEIAALESIECEANRAEIVFEIRKIRFSLDRAKQWQAAQSTEEKAAMGKTHVLELTDAELTRVGLAIQSERETALDWTDDGDPTTDLDDLSMLAECNAIQDKLARLENGEMAPTAVKAAAFDRLMDEWQSFGRQCATEEYTDTGEVWEIMTPYLDEWRPGHDAAIQEDNENEEN